MRRPRCDWCWQRILIARHAKTQTTANLKSSCEIDVQRHTTCNPCDIVRFRDRSCYGTVSSPFPRRDSSPPRPVRCVPGTQPTSAPTTYAPFLAWHCCSAVADRLTCILVSITRYLASAFRCSPKALAAARACGGA